MRKTSVFDTLLERGYIEQLTHEVEIRKLLMKEQVTFYIGFDPTADSLHVGHFLQMMVMSHMQRAGHRPIALIGGGTAVVGDPSGKSDMRKMLTSEEIQHNCNCFKKQMENFIDFNEDKAIMVNNADWLLNLNYVEFLREIGVHFSVSRMRNAECYKQRLENGLSFLEFNYMLMQGYDFLELNKRYDCNLQLGGDDQWSNILAGTDLIRRKEGKPAFGMTFTLLTNCQGNKMGKTENGAIWLDKEKTSPYDFYHYWRTVNDLDVERCLLLLTFLPIEKIRRISSLKGGQIAEAKKTLAFEVTKLIHGEVEAQKARSAVEALFASEKNISTVPTVSITRDALRLPLLDILVETSIIVSIGEGKRFIEQGGLFINEVKVTDINAILTLEDFAQGSVLVKKGKKKNYNKIILE